MVQMKYGLDVDKHLSSSGSGPAANPVSGQSQGSGQAQGANKGFGGRSNSRS